MNIKVQQEIAKFRSTRETFQINDINWLWKMSVMIVAIFCNENIDDIVKVIDMWEVEERLDVDSYDIWLTALLKARENHVEKEAKRFEEFNSKIISNKHDNWK